MNTLDRARDIEATAAAVLAEAGITAAVLLDPAKIPGRLHNGPVIIVQPPELEFTTYTAAEAKWELYVIAGPPGDLLAAWAVLDPIITALQEPLSIETAKAASYRHTGGAEYPAYVLSFSETV